jgi:hypothetical protein
VTGIGLLEYAAEEKISEDELLCELSELFIGDYVINNFG